MAISSALGAPSLPTNYGFRNVLINGGMQINQRNAAVTSIGYVTDRWSFENFAAPGVSVAQNTDAPVGFTHSLRATVTEGNIASGFDLVSILQKIEGFNFANFAFGTASAKTVTVSFWVRSSVVGLHSVSLEQGFGSRIYVGTYSIFSANTWEKKTVIFSGDTSGSWETGNGPGATLRFPMLVGEVLQGSPGVWNAGMYQGATGTVNDCATTGNIFAITGVQLEAGIRDTPFEHRPVGVELSLCQRYYERTWRSMHIGMGVNENGTVATFVNIPITPKRSSTLSVSSTGVLYQHWGGTGGTYSSYDYESSESFLWVKYTSAPLSANSVGMMYLNNGYLEVSAEL